MQQASTFDQIKPLVDLCKAGKLFEVQAWIKAGNPVVPPPPPAKGHTPRGPMEIAVELGFHSLIKVLLDGGAPAARFDDYCPLTHSLKHRRLDLVELFVQYGADPKTIDLGAVFDTWQPAIIDFFIDNGADMEKGYPLAEALCNRIRIALGTFKKYRARYESFPEQVNIALRYHCRHGNLKWVSLMLWAGGNPYATGIAHPSENPEEHLTHTALELALLHRHPEILDIKGIILNPSDPSANKFLRYVCWLHNESLLVRLLDAGYAINDQPTGGSSLIMDCFETATISWGMPSYSPGKYIDTAKARSCLAMVHVLFKRGARWIPPDNHNVNRLRRDLLRLTPDYTLDFI